MAFFPKPAAGSWTENWPELGTAPVDYTDSIDPEHWKLEQQAIFRKTWLQMGRVELVPKKGRYVTRELPDELPPVLLKPFSRAELQAAIEQRLRSLGS